MPLLGYDLLLTASIWARRVPRLGRPGERAARMDLITEIQDHVLVQSRPADPAEWLSLRLVLSSKRCLARAQRCSADAPPL